MIIILKTLSSLYMYNTPIKAYLHSFYSNVNNLKPIRLAVYVP
jgi:hypothetical protein